MKKKSLYKKWFLLLSKLLLIGLLIFPLTWSFAQQEETITGKVYYEENLSGELTGNRSINAQAVFTSTYEDRKRPLRLLVDEYRQFERSEGFSQGFTLDENERHLTYWYATDANAHVNGLFVLEQLIADDFNVQVTREPLDKNLIDRADAYMIVCPPGEAHGGPHPLTAQDSDYLESFVAQGGILILVYNSIGELKEHPFDYEGMNRVSKRFGMEILPTTTRTLGIPIKRDHPAFFGTRGIIYGNGCTIGINPQPHTEHTILLESNNPDVPGPVAVRARYKKGSVLLFGDAGTFGNAHMARNDFGNARAVQQMFHALLPDGPLPGYGWKPGLKMRVALNHELAISGSPHGMRLLDLPLDPATRSVLVGVRDLDLQSAPETIRMMTPEEVEAALPTGRYAFARANWNVETELIFGESDGRAFAARWRGPDATVLECRITPRGEVIDASIRDGELNVWRWALTNAVLPSPLDPSARPGEEWRVKVNTFLPNAQLRPAPLMRQAEAQFRLAGLEKLDGRDCFVVTRRILIPVEDLRPEEIVKPEFADYFDNEKVRLRHAHHTELTTTWIDAASRLPVRTKLRTSTTFWWTDRNEEDWFLSDHDHRIFEATHQTRRVVILGRLLIADFEVIKD